MYLDWLSKQADRVCEIRSYWCWLTQPENLNMKVHTLELPAGEQIQVVAKLWEAFHWDLEHPIDSFSSWMTMESKFFYDFFYKGRQETTCGGGIFEDGGGIFIAGSPGTFMAGRGGGGILINCSYNYNF